MKRFLWFIVVFAFTVGCEKSDNLSNSLEGNYLGIFNRTGMDTVPVSLFFDANRFEGSNSRTYYPAVCMGSFELDNSTIRFVDSCSWTANFDWSLILSGVYNIHFSDGTVRIWKTHGNITDEYLLRQPYR